MPDEATEPLYEIDMVVENAKAPHWGRGKVLEVHGNKLTVFFQNDFEKQFRRITVDHAALTIPEEQADPVLDHLPPFENGAFPKATKWTSLEDAIDRFRQYFTAGFEDPEYMRREREPKMRSHALYAELLGEGQGERLLADGEIKDLAIKAHTVASKGNNLLSPFESLAFHEGLLDDEKAAAGYFEALFALVEAGPEDAPFQALAEAMAAVAEGPGGARVSTWPHVTILPALARPDRFVFLKPEPTRECARRITFPVKYNDQPRWVTYERVLAMCDHLMGPLREHGARDYVDVQSFIWVVAKY